LAVAPLIAAVGAAALSAAQRALSTPARLLRRQAADVKGAITLTDGRTIPVDRAVLLAPLEQALRAMSWAVILLAAALAIDRLRQEPSMRGIKPATPISTAQSFSSLPRRRVSSAGELLTALQRSKGTVTDFLEHLAGEPIDADILSQKTGTAGNDNLLGLESDAELIYRTVLLTGRRSGRDFVYAESAIAVERLPASARRLLESSRDPIGRVITKYHFEIRREPLAGPVTATGNSAAIVELLNGVALARRYLITLGSDPAIVVGEWFLQAVPEALASQAASSGR
jgi:chorismate-pyruvate lyase